MEALQTKGMLCASGPVHCNMVTCRWAAGRAVESAWLSTSSHTVDSLLLSTWLQGGVNPARACWSVDCAALHRSVRLQRRLRAGACVHLLSETQPHAAQLEWQPCMGPAAGRSPTHMVCNANPARLELPRYGPAGRVQQPGR